MEHTLLKRVIADQLEIIKNEQIVNRDEYIFEDNISYVVIGIRRSGKSTLLHKRVQNLIENGVHYEQIVYINFEDERLSEFNVHDFEDIVEVAHERTNKKIYYFLDEIQNVDGFEKFARRLADAHETVYITGSNAKMLSKEIEEKLGGRYITISVTPYTFNEYLLAKKIDDNDSTKSIGRIQNAMADYLHYGGFPDTLLFNNKQDYLKSVYDKILLNDILLHNNIRNEQSMKIMMKKIAESTKDELSYSRIHNILIRIGFKISKDTIIDYVTYAKDSFLLFAINNYYASFIDKESTPKYYFQDNGLLNLFLLDKEPILLENVVAIELLKRYSKNLHYIKSNKTKIDVDFFIPDQLAVQVCYSLDNSDTLEREVNSLIRLHQEFGSIRCIIVTKEQNRIINQDGVDIEVIDVVKFLRQ